MEQFENLLGSSLLSKTGSVNTSTALAGKSAVAIYFSAHWCPPCQRFTPELAKFYNKHKATKNFEIIFASSDKSQEKFDEYYESMPWLALPYGSEHKVQLSQKFKVQGIPTLVVLDETGQKITDKARSFVSSDPEGDEFPWRPKPLPELMKGPLLSKNSTQTIEYSDLSGKTVGFYFSAHWCPPCRIFTPELKKFYEAHAAEKNFEIVFLSSDRDEESFNEYYAEMPWLALPFDDPRSSFVSNHFDFDGSIPTLIIVDSEGKVVTRSARSSVSEDPEGKDFPWIPKPVVRLTPSLVSRFEESAIVFVDYESVAELEADLPKVEDLLKQLPKEDGDEEVVVALTSKSDEGHKGLREKLFDFLNVANNSPKMMVMNLGSGEKHVSNLPLCLDSVEKIVNEFRKKKLAVIGLQDPVN